MNSPDVRELQASLVLLLRDAVTDASVLEGDVTVTIGSNVPSPVVPMRKTPDATFVFVGLAAGSYKVSVRSSADAPYYQPLDFPIQLPLTSPVGSPWPQPWPGYPNVTLADPTKTLNDPGQTAVYLAQREQTALQPTTSYPFPAGTTLVRGIVTAAGVPITGAVVSTALLAQTGPSPVVVVNPDGTESPAQPVTVVATPVITALDPPAVIAGSPDFPLTVIGTGFNAGATVKLAGAAIPATFVSDEVIVAKVSAAAVAVVGAAAVVVNNPGGSSSNQQQLTVAASPAITGLDPATVAAGSPALQLTVTGSGFAGNAAIDIDGNPINTTVANSTQVSATITAAQVAGAGALNVTVVNPGPPPQASNVQALAIVNGPVIRALQPSTLVAGSPAFALAVSGSGFVAGSAINLNGAAVATVFLGATQLTAQVAAAQVAAAGPINVTVSNPGGAGSAAQVLTIVATPTIVSLAPATVTAGSGAFRLAVQGSGFVPGSVVELSGTALTTTYISDTQLDAYVPRNGYTTGVDGTFVLLFDDLAKATETVQLAVTLPGVANQKLQSVTVQRDTTVSVAIDTII
jgi:hypothetical protein